MICGKALTFGNNIDTDQIIGAHYLTLPTIKEMAPHTFEHYPDFVANFRPGDIIVGGHNFGCGSSREQAPRVLQERGVAAIVAISFARIFFRNAINLGILLLECPEADKIKTGEELVIDGDNLRSTTTNRTFQTEPLPPSVRALVESGGIVAHFRQKEDEQQEYS